MFNLKFSIMKHLTVFLTFLALEFIALNLQGSNFNHPPKDFGEKGKVVQKYSHCLDEIGSFSIESFKTSNFLNSGNYLKSGKSIDYSVKRNSRLQKINLESGFVSEEYNEFLEKPEINLDLGSRNKRRRPGVKKDYSWEILGIFASSILLDAVGDGLNDRGDKVWGHGLNAASTGVLLASPFIIDIELEKWRWYAGSYMLMRIGLFDFTYN